jgi:hypothetical protein
MCDVSAHVALRFIQEEEQETASQDPPLGHAPGRSTPENGNEVNIRMSLRLPLRGVKNKKADWWEDRPKIDTTTAQVRSSGELTLFAEVRIACYDVVSGHLRRNCWPPFMIVDHERHPATFPNSWARSMLSFKKRIQSKRGLCAMTPSSPRRGLRLWPPGDIAWRRHRT